MNMRHSILVMASILILFSGCSKEESGTNGPDNGQMYVLDFSSGQTPVSTRAGSDDLMTNSNISISVFSGAIGNGVSTFLDSPYMVTSDAKLAYRTDLKLAGKQAIVSVTPATWSIYGAGVNDGDEKLVLTKNATESASTYATDNGYEYVFAKAENKTVSATAESRKITLTFNRQVAKVVFTVKAGSGLKALPAACTEDQKVETPKMKLPLRGTAAEGLLEVTKGITKPLTQVTTDIKTIYANAVGDPFGFSYFVLPLSTGTTAGTFDVQFQLKVAETGGSLGALRTFDVKNVVLPTRTDGNYGFDMGKQYNYTVTVTNTGLYLSDVNVVDWAISNQGDLPAQ